MLSLDDARQLIAGILHLLPAEHVALAEAQGRVLRSPVTTEQDLPPFDRSTFDGYALRCQTEPAVLRMVGSVAAGQMPSAPVGAGECARIFTGAPLPPGANAVAMQEVCTRNEDHVQIPAIAAGDGVRQRGEDARAGSVLVPAGATLGPVELSLLAQLGVTRPLVSPKPRVFHVRTGDEIVSPDIEPGPGQIRDSNSSLIAGLVAEAGGILAGHAVAEDRLEALVEACSQAEDCDVLLVSGGASVGDFDFGKQALAELGYSQRFTSLNLRPGKPLVFATRGRQSAFVIPGNPLSHFVCWHVVIRAALDLLVTGMAALPLVEMRLGGETKVKGNPRETWWPARVEIRRGEAIAVPAKWQSSGDMTALAGIDLLLRIPSASPGIAPGALVSCFRL